MDIISHRAAIRYLGLKGLTPKEIHEDMVVKLRENAPSYSMVKTWAAKFKRGMESLEDDPRPRRPVTVTTQETITKIHDNREAVSAGKVMASIFWGAEGVLLVDYLNKGHTIFWQDNTPSHTSTVAMAAIQKCAFQLVEHSPYLAASDYYLFPKMKKELRGHHFAWDECCGPPSEWQNGVFYTEEICLLHDCWTKCVNVGGDYVKKMTAFDFLQLTPTPWATDLSITPRTCIVL